MTSGSKKILIVDDDRSIRELLTALLRRDHDLAEAASGEEALELAETFAPDLVLLDIMMPGIDGYETCRRLKSEPSGGRMQIIMVSGKSSREEQLRAYEVGADDYIVKPFDPLELRSRVQLHCQLQEAMGTVESVKTTIDSHNSELRRISQERIQEIMATQDVAVFILAKVAESRDNETGEHLIRMRSYSQILAEELGREGPYAQQIDPRFLEDLYRSSPLHDVGKVGISDSILLKPGPLTPDERTVMQTHTTMGADILDEAVGMSAVGSFLNMAAEIARYHHERVDGTGYPSGLAGRQIPLSARIVAVADVYDALASVRPYKRAFPPQDAKEMIEADSGRHFDPVIVEALDRRFEDFLNIGRQDFDYSSANVATKAYLESATCPSGVPL